jgi:hypothetical protein
MKSRVALLFLGVAFIAAPVFAQGKPPAAPSGGSQQLASDLAALTARVAKLEGNIEASDLAGTYFVVAFSTDMNAVRPDPPSEPAAISTGTLRLNLTLNADGSGHIAPSTIAPGGACEGSTLTLQGTMHAAECELGGAAM